jgi:lysyl-tRNA synthetase class 2
MKKKESNHMLDAANEYESQRIQGRDNLRDLGVNPYGESLRLIQPVATARSEYIDEFADGGGHECRVAGRVVLCRKMGKLVFATIRDDSGDIQIAFSKKQFSDQENLWLAIKGIDLGDIICATGRLGATQTGEITIWANHFAYGAKAITPPPDKHDGLVDQELRCRNRHIDMWSNPEVLKRLQVRSKIIKAIRDCMSRHGYIEVETPILQPLAGGANARPFETHHNSLDIDVVLRIAPELYLKRLLIGGMNSVYEIGKNFRNEGVSPRHNPEFTVIEAYQAWGDIHAMMSLVKTIIFGIVDYVELPDCKITRDTEFKTIRFDDLVSSRMGCQIDQVSDEEAIEFYEKNIEPELIEPTFVTHFPSSHVPLAKRSDDPRWAECFEFVMSGQEIGPGYSEQNDPEEQLKAFISQAGDDQQIADEEFVAALKVGMPPAGGLGIGIDRLVAILTGAKSIRDTIAFPLLRPNT